MIFRLDEVWRRHDLRVQTIDIVSVIDAEGRLDDGQLHAKLNAGGATDAEVCSAGNAQMIGDVGAGKLRRELAEAGRIQPQRTLTNDAVGASIEE